MEGNFGNLTRNWQSEQTEYGTFNIINEPHCLQRDFATGKIKELHQKHVKSKVIEQVLDLNTYEEFYKGLEIQVHNAIPQFVMGDFAHMSAPNGTFFLLSTSPCTSTQERKDDIANHFAV